MEENHQANCYHDAFYYRGKFIDHFNILERSIDEYIAEYIKADKERELDLYTIVINRLTFQSKLDCFIAITKKIAVESGFIKTEKAKWPQSDIYKLIQEAKDERNKFAHFYLHIPEEPVDYIIALMEFRDGGELHFYSKEKYDDLLVKIASADALVNELIKEL